MILFITNSGESLPIALRIQKEGVEAKVYVHNSTYYNNYDGLVYRVKVSELKKAIQVAELVVFDTNRKNEKTKNDLVLLKMFGLPKDSVTVFGALADKIKDVSNVIGASAKAEDIVSKLKTSKKKVEGVELITEGWFNGEEFVFYNHVFENRKFLTGDLGVSLRSQTNLVWISKQPLLQKGFKKLVPILKEAGYKGVIGIKTVISSKNKKPYFLEYTTGFKFDALYCLLSLVEGSIADFFSKVFDVRFLQDYAASERITIPPFPYSEPSLLAAHAKDVRVSFNGTLWGQDIKAQDKGFRVVGADGIVGTEAVTGDTISKAFGNVFKAIHALEIDAPLQYRIDGARLMEKRIRKLDEWGYRLKGV